MGNPAAFIVSVYVSSNLATSGNTSTQARKGISFIYRYYISIQLEFCLQKHLLAFYENL